jgi:cephalosporin hydroxylase
MVIPPSISLRRPDLMPPELISNFSEGYYQNGPSTWVDTYFLGTSVNKNPCDLWILQEIIYNIQPNIIIETGTLHGGSARYFASIMMLCGIKGKVFSIDIKPEENKPLHKYIEYITGDASNPEIMNIVKSKIPPNSTVLVDLDSDHEKYFNIRELDTWSHLVTKGSYLILEDTNVGGPRAALEDWLPRHPEFMIDKGCEKHFLTFNPNGYLKRVA